MYRFLFLSLLLACQKDASPTPTTALVSGPAISPEADLQPQRTVAQMASGSLASTLFSKARQKSANNPDLTSPSGADSALPKVPQTAVEKAAHRQRTRKKVLANSKLFRKILRRPGFPEDTVKLRTHRLSEVQAMLKEGAAPINPTAAGFRRGDRDRWQPADIGELKCIVAGNVESLIGWEAAGNR